MEEKIQIQIEEKTYIVKTVLKSNLKTFENISKTLNNDSLDYADKIVFILKELTDIPMEILEVADMGQLQLLFNQLTEIQKENNGEIANEITINNVVFKTSKVFEKIEDIKLNRTQHKIIKKYIEKNNNYIAAIMACYFSEDGGQIIVDDEKFQERLILFNTEINFEIAIPFLIKTMQTIAIQVGDTIETLQIMSK